jgi:exonuclease III
MQLTTWNVQRLRDNDDCAETFRCLRSMQSDIIASQETHARSEHWGGPAVWTQHVTVLLRPNSGLDFLSDSITLLGGRALAVQITDELFPTPFFLVNIYALVNAAERATFIRQLQAAIEPRAQMILVGNFNAAPLPALDRWPTPHQLRLE